MRIGGFLGVSAAALIGFGGWGAAHAAGSGFALTDLQHIVSLSDP